MGEVISRCVKLNLEFYTVLAINCFPATLPKYANFPTLCAVTAIPRFHSCTSVVGKIFWLFDY